MTSIPAPDAPRRSYLLGRKLGILLRLLPFTLALAAGIVWPLLLAGFLFRRRP